ncbi:MAG: hypothetical protein ACLSV2_01940 [Clostridium sp.]
MGKLFQTREEIRQEMLKDIEDDKIRDDYRISKNQYKNKYRRVIIDIEQLNLEKEIVESQMYRQSLPYFSLVISVGIATMGTLFGLLSSFIQSELDNVKLLPKILVPSIMFSSCMLVVCIFAYKIYQVLENGDLRSKEYYIRLEILKELEKELLENGEFKNYSNEALREVAATQVEVSSEISNKIDKEKRNKIIKGLFKKQNRFERDKKSQEELAQELEKLKTLNQEELDVRKGWYSREAKNCRDIAKNIKNILNMITIILTILSVIIPLFTQVFINQMNL